MILADCIILVPSLVFLAALSAGNAPKKFCEFLRVDMMENCLIYSDEAPPAIER